jgi:predicted AAA+ superfamily ATPase
MFQRTLKEKILHLAQQMPVITITGPRQSGKTTLAKHLFPNHTYINLESPDIQDFASIDPRGFFNTYSSNLILDEVQRVPTLLSYIQARVDEQQINGQFILTGSENLLLSEKINQTLAGRTYIFTLLPLSIEELQQAAITHSSYVPYLYTGFYPRLYAQQVAPSDWIASYIQTYVERDVRQLVNVKNLKQFQAFLRLCAGHIGQLVNYSNFSKAIGVHHTTIKEWLSILEATYIVFSLPPYYRNFKKRLVKSPKLYFYDTGLACSLLGISNASFLSWNSLQGSLFENLVIVELLKRYLNRGLRPHFYIWRDSNGVEVDCLIEHQDKLLAIEMKSTQTLTNFSTSNLKKLMNLLENQPVVPYIIYGGDQPFTSQGVEVLSWKNLDILFREH